VLDPVVVAVDSSAVLAGFLPIGDPFFLKVGSTEYEGILGDGSGRSRLGTASAVGDKGNRVAKGAGYQQEGGSDLEHGVEIKMYYMWCLSVLTDWFCIYLLLVVGSQDALVCCVWRASRCK
jgi:hypothetical protein